MFSQSIGIATIVDHGNFGNRLQNLALQRILQGLGHHVVTVRNSPRPGAEAAVWRRHLATLRCAGPIALAKRARHDIRVAVNGSSAHPLVVARRRNNGSFTRDNIIETDAAFEDLEAPKDLSDLFDRFIVGSDQVWNPSFRLVNSFDFLTFARPEQRIAYAASFGVEHFTRFVQNRYRELLPGIPLVSVREFEAAKTFHELTGREVPVVLDPTMLISGSEWETLASEVSVPTSGYVASFLLRNPEGHLQASIERYAMSRHLALIPMNDLAKPEHYSTSIAHFLSLILRAELLITDSFHAAVFATLFHTPYAALRRGSMTSRLTTLASHSGIEALDWSENSDLDSLRDVDWVSVDRRLASRRERSISFLREALDVKSFVS